MIERFGFYVNSFAEGETLPSEDGDYVRYEDHVAALAVDEAMARRFLAAMSPQMLDSRLPWHAEDISQVIKGLTAALTPERGS